MDLANLMFGISVDNLLISRSYSIVVYRKRKANKYLSTRWNCKYTVNVFMRVVHFWQSYQADASDLSWVLSHSPHSSSNFTYNHKIPIPNTQSMWMWMCNTIPIYLYLLYTFTLKHQCLYFLFSVFLWHHFLIYVKHWLNLNDKV